MKEYAFDVKLWAVARVEAETEAQARRKMIEALECIDVGFCHDGVRLTEASIEDSGEDSDLIDEEGESGVRVRLLREVDNFPTVTVPAGETGTITEQTDECTWVRLDRHYPELNEWDNRLEIWHWDGEGPGLEPIAETATLPDGTRVEWDERLRTVL